MFYNIAKPLTRLTVNDHPFHWENENQFVFITLKELTHVHLLSYPAADVT